MEKMTQPGGIPWAEQAQPVTVLPQRQREILSHGRVNLYHITWLRPLIESRWPQFLVRSLTLAGFVLTITAAILGSPVGSHNFAIITVWIAWWTALKLFFIPLGGRSWCSICPIPLPGDWLQQSGILEKSQRAGIGLRWPKRLRGTWLQSAGFLLIGIFSAVTLTDARVTGIVLVSLFVLATLLSLVFEKRAFCSYICPIGGFSGMYAKLAPMEVRVVEREKCATHMEKSCYKACPWGLYPLAFKDSSACGLCMECLRSCPRENLAINLRPYGSDVGDPIKSNKLDEAFLAITMISSVLVFSAVFIGPWGWLKSAAFMVGSPAWIGYALGFLLLSLVISPVIYTSAVAAGRKILKMSTSLKHEIANQAQALLPLGLLAWIAFTFSFALPKLNLILTVLNDPFGWGWRLLGLQSQVAAPDVSAFSPMVQVALILVGLIWSAGLTSKLSATNGNTSRQLNLPVLAFSVLFSALMLWLLVG